MQNPVRFYISQSDDHPVVRSVPVLVDRPGAATGDEAPAVQPVPAESAATAPVEARRPRVGQLVRAATRRTDLRR
jgi:hypothetical protein